MASESFLRMAVNLSFSIVPFAEYFSRCFLFKMRSQIYYG